MVSVFGKLFTTLAVVYSIYLLTYKCAQLNETPLEHGAEVVFHPISHTHNQLCDGLNTGVNFVHPYLTQAQLFLDQHVHSHPLFQKYEVHDKVVCAKGQYFKHVYPYVVQLWQLVEIIEVHVYDQVTKLYHQLLAQYHSHVAPKVEEVKAKVL